MERLNFGIYIYFLVVRVVMLCVLRFLVPCCDVRYDFSIKTMFGSSLPPVVCRKSHVIFILFVLVNVWWCPTPIREHLDSPPDVGGVRVAHLYSFLCFVLFVFILCLVYPMLPVSLDCPFLIAPSVFSNVYLFCLSSSCVLCTQCCQCLWIVHS